MNTRSLVNRVLVSFAISLPLMAGTVAAEPAELPPMDALHEQSLSIEQVLQWRRWGQGLVDDFRGEAVQMAESEGSKGVVLSSRDDYGERVVLRYRALTLKPGTVLVAILSASDNAETTRLTMPTGYDGGIGPWISGKPGYFFAFHNAPHMRKPFAMRLPAGDGEPEDLAEADEHVMRVGRWHEIEVGRWGEQVWLKIDGTPVLQATDPAPHTGGHIALRIRGTGIEQASCLVRDVRVLTPVE